MEVSLAFLNNLFVNGMDQDGIVVFKDSLVQSVIVDEETMNSLVHWELVLPSFVDGLPVNSSTIFPENDLDIIKKLRFVIDI